jgi:2-dehydropantoate 2-reductase
MKILFFGRGVIGTQYAWAFGKAGHTVEFYVREGRKTQYGSYVNLEQWDVSFAI